MPLNDDFNGAEQDGFGRYQVTQRGGMRASAAVAYLHPAMERPNLDGPAVHARAHRVLFEGTRAVGVEASSSSAQVSEFRAEREVILCGGAYNSPQLLHALGHRPGRAPDDEARSRSCSTSRRSARTSPTTRRPSRVWTTPEPVSACCRRSSPAALEEFEATRPGVLTSNLAEAGGFVRVGDGRAGARRAVPRRPRADRRRGDGRPGGPRHAGSTPCLLHPESRGSVRLQNNDPTGKPVIRNNYYAAEADTQLADRRRCG